VQGVGWTRSKSHKSQKAWREAHVVGCNYEEATLSVWKTPNVEIVEGKGDMKIEEQARVHKEKRTMEGRSTHTNVVGRITVIKIQDVIRSIHLQQKVFIHEDIERRWVPIGRDKLNNLGVNPIKSQMMGRLSREADWLDATSGLSVLTTFSTGAMSELPRPTRAWSWRNWEKKKTKRT